MRQPSICIRTWDDEDQSKVQELQLAFFKSDIICLRVQSHGEISKDNAKTN